MSQTIEKKSVWKARARAPNFTKEEQTLLFKAMNGLEHIVESKKTDSVKQADKAEAWQKIADIFNANTRGPSRNPENLMTCFRNFKSRVKKNHSEAKMLLEDPVIKENFINVLEEDGKDWDKISNVIDQDVEVCEEGYKILEKEFKKKDAKHKRSILATGGGPPSSDDDDPIFKIKKVIEPQIDGLFTIYDADAAIMEQFQGTLPEKEQKTPVEYRGTRQSGSTVKASISPCREIEKKEIKELSRTEILRKRKATPLRHYDCTEPTTSTKKTVTESFKDLSQMKMEFVKLQTEALKMDMAHKKRLFELELQDRIKDSEFKNIMRQKELELINLKIKNVQQWNHDDDDDDVLT